MTSDARIASSRANSVRGLERLNALRAEGKLTKYKKTKDGDLFEAGWYLCGQKLVKIVKFGVVIRDELGKAIRKEGKSVAVARRPATVTEISALMKWCVGEERRKKGKKIAGADGQIPDMIDADIDPEKLAGVRNRMGGGVKPKPPEDPEPLPGENDDGMGGDALEEETPPAPEPEPPAEPAAVPGPEVHPADTIAEPRLTTPPFYMNGHAG